MVPEGFPRYCGQALDALDAMGSLDVLDVFWQTLQMKHPHLPHSRPTRYRTFRMGRLRIDVCADSLRRPLRVNPSKSASSR